MKKYFRLIIELLFIGILIGIDMLTKEFIYQPIYSSNEDILIINGVIRFTAVQNTGASFGMFSQHTIVLTIISLVTVIFVFLFLVVSYKKLSNRLIRSSLVLIISGGVGNLVDRFSLGHVRDFIYFELIDFAVFNFADSCLTIGCILLLIYVVLDFFKKNEKS